jgi:hypothetical protein
MIVSGTPAAPPRSRSSIVADVRRSSPWRGWTGSERLAAMLVAVLSVLAFSSAAAGCAAASRQDASEELRARREAMTRITAADRRLASLDRFEATGTAVLPVRNPEGAIEEEQLDLLILRERPGRLAVRLKLSVTDTLAWLGSDGARWWLFLPEETPPTVWHGPVDPDGEASTPEDRIPLPPTLRRPMLVDLLLGLEPVGEFAALEWDASSQRWWIEGPIAAAGMASTAGWTVRRGYARDGSVPEVVEVRDPAGDLVARSRLSNHARVEVPDRAVGDWPMVPMRIELAGPADEGSDEAPAVRLALERPSGRGRRVKAAAFDWDRLLRAMRPERVVDVGAAP